ncbi:MAG: tRNA (uridine(34)/cytosine(34)/5-carboxymethylaminomethyluridine(34)-2'-O)-methyltransferase TrmL [Verrucomicrobiales bacterium]|nr:tRNA (uridine(34)/cytosine(34)/5-carboxymethylaminomethyluridine(34)-2'-O)-methyltransferase TrmL [Verrucomicrobiales bacterium]|tara:strand:+ start:518 stop:997 length:480 start_codon:yes stop_codon:yes gene_type:complete
MNIVLVEPEIPPNTGNIARLCAATRTDLHLIEPLGFELNDKRLKRAAMDYWNQVNWRTWPEWSSFERERKGGQIWLIESTGTHVYSEAEFSESDYFVFGRETAGLPEGVLSAHPDHILTIPMFNSESRSLNLSNAVSIVLYEALRQQGFEGALPLHPRT